MQSCRPVTDSYEVEIAELSVGVYMNSKGFSVAGVGIEEKSDKNTGRDYRRYWLLEMWECPGKHSLIAIHNYLRDLKQAYNIANINTNFKHILDMYPGDKYFKLIDIEPENIITLIRGLNADGKLEIPDDYKETVNDLFSNYDIENDNLFINSLYLALNFKLNHVIISCSFSALPTPPDKVDFETISLDDLMAYCFSDAPDRLEAHEVFRRRIPA